MADINTRFQFLKMADDRLEEQHLSRDDAINAVLNYTSKWTTTWGIEAIRGLALDNRPLKVYFEERAPTLIIIQNVAVIDLGG